MKAAGIAGELVGGARFVHRARVVVGLVIDVVVKGGGGQDQAIHAVGDAGVEQQAQAVGGQAAFVEVVVAVVAARVGGNFGVLVLQAGGQGVGGIDPPVQRVSVIRLASDPPSGCEWLLERNGCFEDELPIPAGCAPLFHP